MKHLSVLIVAALGACSSSDKPKQSSARAAREDASRPAATKKQPAEQLPPDQAAHGKTWTFDDEPTGHSPGDFTAATGEWILDSDPTTKDRGTVLAQTARNPSAVFNVVLVNDTRYGDVDITVELRAITGKIDQGGGVVWRAADAKNYYIARYNPLEDNLRVYYVKQGRRTMLQSATVRLDHEAWHTLRVTMTGDYIVGYLNGNKHLDTHDTTFADPGMIGLWTKADAVTNFDELSVRGKQE